MVYAFLGLNSHLHFFAQGLGSFTCHCSNLGWNKHQIRAQKVISEEICPPPTTHTHPHTLFVYFKIVYFCSVWIDLALVSLFSVTDLHSTDDIREKYFWMLIITIAITIICTVFIYIFSFFSWYQIKLIKLVENDKVLIGNSTLEKYLITMVSYLAFFFFLKTWTCFTYSGACDVWWLNR